MYETQRSNEWAPRHKNGHGNFSRRERRCERCNRRIIADNSNNPAYRRRWWYGLCSLCRRDVLGGWP